MAFDRFLIAPLNSGLEKDKQPWLISDDAFAELRNAYNYRGRIRKRFGATLLRGSDAVDEDKAQLLSRLRLSLTGTDTGFSTNGAGDFGPAVVIAPPFVVGQKFLITDGASSEIFTIPSLGAAVVLNTTGGATTRTLNTTTGSLTLVGSIANATIYFIDMISGSAGLGITDGSGDAVGVIPGAVPAKVGQLFSIGSEIYTVNALGTPATLLSTGSGVFTFNTTTGEYSVTGAPINTQIYFYPAEPVMGLLTFERAQVNDESLYAFDTQFAYFLPSATTGGWDRLGTTLWTGTNSDFFWGDNYHGLNSYENSLFVTNYTNADGLKYYDGAWNNLVPVINAAGDTVLTARIVLPFKDRLLLLNTVESIAAIPRTFTQRCRFSQNGDPTAAATAWLEDTPGRGGYIDAPTKEAIVSAEFLRDRLIVFFERSTWELVYTGNQVLPFTWQKINTELGAESTFSIIPFDKVVLGIGNIGIHACNGANVDRIDDKIPDEVFKIHNQNDGPERVYGIRDYDIEAAYWSFPSQEKNQTFPDRVLVFNYKNGTWAVNDDTITCFGYYQNPNDVVWQMVLQTWEEYEDQWNSGDLQALYRQVIAGNQQGFTFIIEPDNSSNCPALQVTDLSVAANVVTLTVVDHNLKIGDHIYLQFFGGITGLDAVILPVDDVIDDDTVTVLQSGVTGTYTGGGTLQRVSNIDIRTKDYNFYLKEGDNMYLQKIGFYVDKTENGEIMVNVYVSAASNLSLPQQGSPSVTGALIGTSVLETKPFLNVPFEGVQYRLWHAVYTQGEGNSVQLQLTMNDAQMRTASIAFSDFVLNAFMIYAQRTDSYF